MLCFTHFVHACLRKLDIAVTMVVHCVVHVLNPSTHHDLASQFHDFTRHEKNSEMIERICQRYNRMKLGVWTVSSSRI